MTSTPQSDGLRQTALFSKAWSTFAQTQKPVRPSDATATDGPGEDERAANRVDASAPEKTAAESAEQTQETKHRLSATVAASASISAKVKPGFAETCFSALSYVAFLALPLLLLARFATGFYALTPWLLPQEAHFAETYELMLASGHWLMAPAAFPPAWFWMLRLLNSLPYVDGPVVYAAGAALSGALTLLATWFLALSAGYDRRTAFASGLVLLSCLAFPPLAHRVGPELFFTGLLTLGLASLIRGWNKKLSFLWLPLGCALIAIAGLTNGIFGIVLPLFGSLAFLAWKGAFSRLNKMDSLAAFAVLLSLPLAWMSATALFGPGDALLRELCAQFLAPFLPPYWPPKDPVWLYAAVLPSALVPWIFVPLFVSWGSALSQPLARLASTRRENSGSAWIWIHLAAGLLLLSAMSSKFCLNMLPLMPLLAIVLGKAVVNLPQTNSRAFFLVPAVLFGLAALALGLAGLAQLWPQIQGLAPLPYPRDFAAIKGLPILAGICLFAAIALWKLVDRRFPGACLLACAVAVTALCLPARMLTSPSMQDLLLGNAAIFQSIPASPASQAAPAPKPHDENAAPRVGAQEKASDPAASTENPEAEAPASGQEKPAQNP